jgi:HNH endonuclease
MPPARRSLNGRAAPARAPRPPIRRRRRPPGDSSTPTRWPCCARRRCITSWIPARRASGTRSWSMSMPRSSPTRRGPANARSKRWATFPRKRLAAWRATRAGWSCARRARPPARDRSPHADESARLRRALLNRDRPCRFPGCQVRVGQGHHVRHWVNGGPTTLSNLVLLCRRHHRAMHEEGYQVECGPDGNVGFRRPDGTPLPDVPSPSAVLDDPIATIRERHRSQGLDIDSRTACPAWGGERLDVGWAIDVLHPRAAPAGLAPATPPPSAR